MPFEFVNNAAIDRKARKLIRSQAAKGKNVGKKRQPRRRRPEAAVKCASLYTTSLSSSSSSLASLKSQVAEDEEAQLVVANKEYPVVERQIGDGWSILSFPTEVAPGSKAVVQRAFMYLSGPHGPPGLRSVIDYTGAGSQMIACMFVDEAYFHCAIAMCYKSLGSLRLGEENTSEAMRHISLSYRLINEKLSGKQALDDTTMVAVLGMTHWERIQGRHRDSVTHLQGLLRIVQLRGGISQFASEQPHLAHKVFRADLEIALHIGSATQFTLQDITKYAGESWLQLGFEEQHHTANLQDVLSDITHFASTINWLSGQSAKLDHHDFNNCLIMLGYRLISVSPLNGPRPSNKFEDILHLGLAGFLTTFLLEIGARPQGFPLLTQTTRAAIDMYPGNNVEYQELLLWTLFIASSSTFRRAEDSWLIPRVAETLSELDLTSWDEVLRTVSKFPWINNVHDKPGQDLWRRTQTYCATRSDSTMVHASSNWTLLTPKSTHDITI